MKFVIVIVCLIALLGGAYGLARLHIIPLAGVAKSSPIAAKLLTKMNLITPAPKPVAAAPAQPTVDPLAAEKAQLALEQNQLDQEKAAIAHKAVAATAPPLPPAITPTSPQLIEIYEAMNSDDLATLFAKEPDSAVVSALIAMDTKKAAKALAAIPPDRGAKITALMNQAMAMAQSNPQPPTP